MTCHSFIQGTLLTRGQALAEVVATGTNTEIGRIGVALSGAEVELTPLQHETARVIRRIAGVAILLAAVLVVMYGVLRGGWVDAMLAGITLAMAILPQEFPVVLTVFLALGAWRISKQRVLTRRIPAIETLGAATVLCVDKTGTLTMNRMTGAAPLSRRQRFMTCRAVLFCRHLEFNELVEYSVLASESEPFDPMEKAFRQLADATGSPFARWLDDRQGVSIVAGTAGPRARMADGAAGGFCRGGKRRAGGGVRLMQASPPRSGLCWTKPSRAWRTTDCACWPSRAACSTAAIGRPTFERSNLRCWD
jgi:magnesium-transporting ATPase (P-type)